MESIPDLTGARWRKSSHSSAQGQCVEVAAVPSRQVAVRDSKNPEGPALVLSRAAFAQFLYAAASGRL